MNNCLFLTTLTSPIYAILNEHLSSFQLHKRWKTPLSCKINEYIDDIVYNNGTLALIMKASSNNAVIFDLQSSKTLDRLWTFPMDINKSWFQQTIRCCSLKYDEWLVIEGNTSRLFHILTNGKVKATEK
ncbi:unnamed protein product [Rotaria magnacalcarata]|uniref:Uncharacterized protein n=2 Tax=Rotaria magnacalcarata TaxID=392030 RepID=A0A814XPW1_9BILA|nr:unnamed protein product [Rotaria magnacalcarata]CAF4368279.1 unnamed protein product [Rotaria magnacalcarata]